MKQMTPEELEQFIQEKLRSLPPRPAPRSLEARVLAALERQALVPWYHRSWAYWPAAMRLGFVTVASGFAAVAVAAFYLMRQGAESGALAAAFSERFSVLAALWRAFSWSVHYVSDLIGAIPPAWLYGGLAFVGAMYAVGFGLGAAAYRVLYRNS